VCLVEYYYSLALTVESKKAVRQRHVQLRRNAQTGAQGRAERKHRKEVMVVGIRGNDVREHRAQRSSGVEVGEGREYRDTWSDTADRLLTRQ
jgi:hypothetical protein